MLHSKRCLIILLVCTYSLLVGCYEARKSSTVETNTVVTPADRILFNARVVTIDVEKPTAAAVAIKNGKIIGVGTDLEMLALADQSTLQQDLQGHALLPGFIDAHSHFNNALQLVNWANVSSPPVGPVADIPTLIDTLNQHIQRFAVKKGEWIIAYGYDQDGLKEARHLTVDDLDPYFPNNPLILIHVSNHGAVLNSLGLKTFDIDDSTKTPEGGVIARKTGSNDPAGLLMETAFLPVFSNLPQPNQTEKIGMMDVAQQMYASQGYTSIQEGATHYSDYETIQLAAEQGELYLDLMVLPLFTDIPVFLANEVPFMQEENNLLVGGVKLVTDGSPQGLTAYFTKPFLVDGPTGQKNWHGEPTLPEAQFAALINDLVTQNIRTVIHANGDAGIDLAIRSLQKAGVKAAQDRRDLVIHSQFMRPDQLDQYVELGITPSFFTNHTFFWGDVHVKNLGEERAAFLSPMKSAQERGIRFSNHTDFSVTPLDPFMTLWTATQRNTRSNRVLGLTQRVDMTTALRAITLDAAYQRFEENIKGSISVGKNADLVILSDDPLNVEGDQIRSLRVLETIKDGETVYQRQSPP